MQTLTERLRTDFGRKSFGELIQEREAAALEIERLTGELARRHSTHVSQTRAAGANVATPETKPRIDPLGEVSRPELLRLKDVCQIVALARSTIYPDAIILLNMGRSYFMLGDNGAAIDWLHKFLEQNKMFPVAYAYLAMAYALNNDEANARGAMADHRWKAIREHFKTKGPLTAEQRKELRPIYESIRDRVAVALRNKVMARLAVGEPVNVQDLR